MNMQQKGASMDITTNPSRICKIPETRHIMFATRIPRQFHAPKITQTVNDTKV
jgi:hypothetical protein